MTIGRSDLGPLGAAVPGLPASPSSGWLAAIPLLCMSLLLAGTPLAVAVAGRSVPLGPFDAGLVALVLLLPTWWRRLPPLTGATAAGAAFIMWCGFSAVLWSIDLRRSGMAVLLLVQAALVFVICYNVFATSTRSAFLVALRAFGLVLSIQILWVVFHLVTTGDAVGFYEYKNETRVPLGASNFLAIFLEFCLVYELVRRARGWFAVAALEAIALFATFSRGALVALGGGLVLVSLWFLAQRDERRRVLVLVAVAAAATLVLVSLPQGQLLFRAFGMMRYTAGSRIELWSYAWNAAAEAPLTGVGFGAYESVGGVRDPHTTPLKLLAETGMPGTLLFTLMLVGFVAGALGPAFRRVAHEGRRREAWALSLGLAPVIAHSLIEPFFFNRSVFWIAIVLAWMAALPWSPAFPPDGPDPPRDHSRLTAT